MRTLFISGLFLATSLAVRAQAPAEPMTWQDEDTGTVLVVAKAPSVQNSQSVRDQLAGCLHSWLAMPCLPIKFGRESIGGLPAFYMRAVLFTESEAQSLSGFTVFAKDQTFIVIVKGADDVEFKYVEAHAGISGTPNTAAAAVLEEVAEKAQAGLPEIKRLAIARNRAAVEKLQAELRRDDAAIDAVKSRRGDLSKNDTNAEALNRRLRALKPSRIYGWGSDRLSDAEQSVTFSYEVDGKTSLLVWIVNTASQSSENISADVDKVEALRAKRKISLPSDQRLLAYDPGYDMASFKNSDYYRGRGTDPLDRPIK